METRFGPYELLEPLAAGGMARVYKARLLTQVGGLEKIVALKLMQPVLASDPGVRTMFVDEARIAATLSHQNIVGILDFGEKDGELFIAMEYVAGANLRVVIQNAVMKKQLPTPQMAAWVVAEAARGLKHAHERVNAKGEPLGIVHRDVSPQNIVVSWSGEVKILDFGIARSREKSFQTAVGTIKGKYAYMSPEQAMGGAAVDARTDLWALGAVLYELLTGEKAFPDPAPADALRKVIDASWTMPANVPAPLADVLSRTLAKRASDRFANAAELIDTLQRFLAESRVAGGPPSDAGAVAAWLGRVFAGPPPIEGSSDPTASLVATGNRSTLTFSTADADDTEIVAKAGETRILPTHDKPSSTAIAKPVPPENAGSTATAMPVPAAGSSPATATTASLDLYDGPTTRPAESGAPRVWVDAEPTSSSSLSFASMTELARAQKPSARRGVSGAAAWLLFFAGAIGAALITVLVSQVAFPPDAPPPPPTPFPISDRAP